MLGTYKFPCTYRIRPRSVLFPARRNAIPFFGTVGSTEARGVHPHTEFHDYPLYSFTVLPQWFPAIWFFINCNLVLRALS
jgi:hypothetical protein